jgi:LPS-assembly lipoprotein
MLEARRNETAVWKGMRTRRALTGVLLFGAFILSGCGDGGFRPMYGGAAVGGAGASEKLAQVDISTIPGRVGQQLRNEFIYQSSGGGARPEPVYRLEVAVRESLTSTLIDTTGDARAQVYNLDASFKLIRIADSQVVMEGMSYSRAAFDRFNSIYSNVRAREDAETRAAKTIAEDLRTRIGAYVATAA